MLRQSGATEKRGCDRRRARLPTAAAKVALAAIVVCAPRLERGRTMCYECATFAHLCGWSGGLHCAAACSARGAVVVNLAFGAVLRGNSHRECGSRRIPAAAVRRFPDAAVRRSGTSAVAPTAARLRQRRIFASLAARGCLYL